MSADGLTRTQRHRLKDVDAYRKKKREYARSPEERAKRTKYMREWREKNRARHNELARESHRRSYQKPENKQKKRDRGLWDRYGITGEDYDRMFAEQAGLCKICGKPPKKIHLHVDHDHATGEVRGLLCNKCNTSLGWYELYGEAAQRYLREV